MLFQTPLKESAFFLFSYHVSFPTSFPSIRIENTINETNVQKEKSESQAAM